MKGKTKEKSIENLHKKRRLLYVSLIVVILVVITLSLLLVIDGIDKTTEVFFTGDTIYQYEALDPSDFKVVEEGKIKTSTYTLDDSKGHDYNIVSPVCMGDTVSVIIDDVTYTVKVDYVESIEPISWTYEGSTSIPSDLTEDTVDVSKIEGIITYTDGTTKEVYPQSVVLEKSKTETILYLLDGLITYKWDAVVSE